MAPEDSIKILDDLNPTIELIEDSDVKPILNTLVSLIHQQQKTIDKQHQTIANQRKKIEKLEEKLNTNSDNSSNPPSTQPFKANKKNKKKKKGKRGGQPGHKGSTRRLLPEGQVDHIEQHKPEEHCPCGGHVAIGDKYQRHQVHEIPPMKTVVTEHQFFSGHCDQCGRLHQAQRPSNVPTGMLGPYLLAFIATLTSDYKLSKRDVTHLLKDLYHLIICPATVKRAEESVSAAISASVEEATTYVQNQAVVNADETSHAECGKKKWTWVAIGNTVAVFMIAPSRSTKAAKALLGEGFKGIVGSDRYRAYAWIPTACRQVCWAHLKRDFKKISERAGMSTMMGLRLLVYTKRLFYYWHLVRDGTLTRASFKDIMKPIRDKMELLLLKGSQADHDKTKGTCLEILKTKEALWTFIDNVGVEPTNNIAERVLRKIVIWRKVCFGTWSENGTRYLERVMTVAATCRLQERSVLGFLREAVQAHLNGEKAPSLLPSDVLDYSDNNSVPSGG